MIANYEIFLREKDSNSQTTLLQGDNTNPENDQVDLPAPASVNDGRRVVLETGFYGTDVANHSDYEIVFEIYQDNILLGSANDKDKLTGKGQYSLIFIKLEKQ